MSNLVKRLRDWEHVHPEDQDKPEGHLYEEAADRIEEMQSRLRWVITERDDTFVRMRRRVETAEAENKRMREALREAIYMLDPEAEDILKGAGIYRIMQAHRLSGGVMSEDLMGALKEMEKSDDQPYGRLL